MAHELHRYFLRSTIGVIFLTVPLTGLAAMGDMTLSAPMLDSTFTVNKWNCVFHERDLIPKPYTYQCLIVLGTLNEVEETLSRLDATYSNTTP